MITITPRSFTNGLYFKGFRSYLLTESALDLIHIFKHRDKVFRDSHSAVLQENIICHFIKGKKQKELLFVQVTAMPISISQMKNNTRLNLLLILQMTSELSVSLSHRMKLIYYG